MAVAIVTCDVFERDKTTGKPLARATLEMQDDLPSGPLGMVVGSAIHQAWKAGHNPVDCRLVIKFDVKFAYTSGPIPPIRTENKEGQ